MLWVIANHIQPASALHDLALGAALANGRSYLHDLLLYDDCGNNAKDRNYTDSFFNCPGPPIWAGAEPSANKVRMRGPSSVIATECSKWQVSEWS